MDVAGIAGLLRERARLRARDGWSREAVVAFQAERLAELRCYATAHSPFYRDLHRGLADSPLAGLPIRRAQLTAARD